MAHRIELRARANQYFSYSGHSLLVTNLAGDVPTSGANGYYFENTRLPSRFELTANGYWLRPIVASPVDGAAFLAYQEVPKEAGVPERAINVQIAHFLDGGLRTCLRLENYHGVKTDKASHTALPHAGFEQPAHCQFGPDGALYVVDWGEIEIAPERGGVRMQQETGTLWRIRRTEGRRGERPPAPLVIPLNLPQLLMPTVIAGLVVAGFAWLVRRILTHRRGA
jgi:hypothetical protein